MLFVYLNTCLYDFTHSDMYNINTNNQGVT